MKIGINIGNIWLKIITLLIITTMSSLLYLIAIILVIGWIFGALVYSVGGLIHILLVLAVIAVLFRLIGGRSV